MVVAMRWVVYRLSLIALGAALVLYSLQLMHRGIYVYQNVTFRATTYSAGNVALGIFIGLLAFLPPASLVDRWIARRKERNSPDRPEHPSYHHRHHGPK